MQDTNIKWLTKELPYWVKKGFITPEKADELLDYYSARRGVSPVSAFSVIGFLLVGLGIILILAYNWDNIGRTERTALAFGLLIAGQLAAVLAKRFRYYSTALMEGSAVFWLCAIGAAVAIIGQTYHLGGDLHGFLTLWVLLGIPVVYLMRSDAAALFTLAGITYFAADLRGGEYLIPLAMWAAWLPHYIVRFIYARFTNSFVILSCVFFVSSLVSVSSFYADDISGLWIVIFTLVPSVLYLLGSIFFRQAEKAWQNPFTLCAKLLLTLVLFFLISISSWKYIDLEMTSVIFSKGGLWAAFLFYLFLVWQFFKRRAKGSLLFVFAPLIALAALFIADGFYSMLFVNIAVIAGALHMVINGGRNADIGRVNHGLIFISAVILIQFFEGDFGLIAKGSVFIGVGLGLLLFNIFLHRRIARLK